jgi:hypothetical protein
MHSLGWKIPTYVPDSIIFAQISMLILQSEYAPTDQLGEVYPDQLVRRRCCCLPERAV